MAFARVYSIFRDRGLHRDVVFGGSGKLGFPGEALIAMSLGADFIGVAREAMLAVGCIQAQECHTGHCPTGVATHSKWLTRGLDPTDKSVRVMNYIVSLRAEILKLSHACGVSHPALVPLTALEMVDSPHDSNSMLERFGYELGAEDHRLSAEQRETIDAIMAANGEQARAATTAH